MRRIEYTSHPAQGERDEKASLTNANKGVRINKYLAGLGVAARRDIDTYITDGRITLNGVRILKPGALVHDGDVIELDGRRIDVAQPDKTYIILNKPKGYITTTDDEYGRHHVLDLVKTAVRIFPVGRLDRDTTGLLLLTNDGDLAHRLMHPRFEIEKRYRVLLDAPLSDEDKEVLERGVAIEKDEPPTAPCEISWTGPARNRIEIVIHEGRNRQIRKMFAVTGYTVVALERIRYAGLTLEGLSAGSWRNLSSPEVQILMNAVHGRS